MKPRPWASITSSGRARAEGEGEPANIKLSTPLPGRFRVSSIAFAYRLRLGESGDAMRSFLIRIIVLTTLGVSLSGCAAALVGGLIYKSTKSNEEKANFVTNLQKTNLEREKAHLKPLDWCSEAYKFDKGWATENPECGQRVAAYEGGDKTALAQ
jgi:hypothetical protein